MGSRNQPGRSLVIRSARDANGIGGESAKRRALGEGRRGKDKRRS
jgi:hypothetical protein